jgi:hypothetical protein
MLRVGAGGAENPKRDRSLADGDHTARNRAAREADRLRFRSGCESFGPSLQTLAMDERQECHAVGDREAVA